MLFEIFRAFLPRYIRSYPLLLMCNLSGHKKKKLLIIGG